MKQWETFVLVQHLSLTSYQDLILWDKVLIVNFLASDELATCAIMACKVTTPPWHMTPGTIL